jgi:ABC-type uncharacterized transport system auxiliary subunit
MRNAARILIIALSAATLAACHKQQPRQNQEIAVDENLPSSELPANAEIETLPADESSTTPSNQLQNGYDNPDVNNLGNGD